ncbi:MAG TPA: N-(5'-phosphoribosyl)anthranilate isomerase [Chloroflexi bacterium]|nr:N-(5'-phosphoribosyl)anthranilate isomerase [Chloroflexota bacterium]HHW84739.1 phosphoribosylanthranilate isomerase [Chloroflexota bacterium]
MTIVKICGLTNLEDALVAAETGADLLGFILYPKSPRYVAPETITAIVAGVRKAFALPPRCVGVFVNASTAQVLATLDQTKLDLAQLHGDESASEVAALRGRGFKAMRPTNLETALAAIDAFASLGAAAGPQLLVDAYTPNAYGGAGQVADWSLAAAVAQRVDRLLLAGGLTPENVADAVRQVKPWGVDVASGVERAPGRKDHAKVRAFIAAAKNLTLPFRPS